MPSALRFRVPVQGEGIGGGVGQESGVEWSHVFNLAADANGSTGWSRQKNYTGFTHDTEYLMRLRNRGSGGRHLIALKSTDASTILTLTDAGLSLATALTSTVATGTAPFVVASTTVVTNLNADMVDGQSLGDLDDRYINEGGDTTSGNYTFTGSLDINTNLDVEGESTLRTTTVTGAGAGNDQALFVQHGSGDGRISLGATDSATPNLILKNNAGTQITRITNEGVLLPGTLTSVPASAEDGDVVCDDLFVWDSASNYRRISANGNALQISNNGDSGTHLTIDSAGIVTITTLQVDDSVNISNDLEVDSNALFRGDVDILDDVTIGSDLLVSGSSTFTDPVRFTDVVRIDDSSGAGFTEDTWSGFFRIRDSSDATKYVPYLSTSP